MTEEQPRIEPAAEAHAEAQPAQAEAHAPTRWARFMNHVKHPLHPHTHEQRKAEKLAKKQEKAEKKHHEEEGEHKQEHEEPEFKGKEQHKEAEGGQA